MISLPASILGGKGNRATDRPPVEDAPPGLRSALRKALLGLAVLVVALLVSRRLGSRGR